MAQEIQNQYVSWRYQSMTFEEFMSRVDYTFQLNHPNLRYGQTIMNVLFEVWPEEYTKIKDSDNNCFYYNGNCEYVLNYLENIWSERFPKEST